MRPRVCFVIPRLGIGGAERVASELSFELSGIELEIVVFREEDGFEVNGTISSLELQLDDRASSVVKSIRFAEAATKLALLGIDREYDAFVAFTTPANLLTMIAPTGIPRILSVHSTESVLISGPKARVVQGAVRYLYSRADKLIAVSHSVADDLTRALRVTGDVSVIYNPTDLGNIGRLAARPPGTSWHRRCGENTIATMGRLVPAKGQWYLLRAFARLKQSRPSSTLLVLGDGPLMHALQGECSRLGLSFALEPEAEADVYFAGFQKNPFAFIARCKVFAFPSIVEGFGNALVEALACGVPAVATDCPSGPREIFFGRRPPVSAPHSCAFGTLIPRWPGTEPFADEPNAAPTVQQFADALAYWLDRDTQGAQLAAKKHAGRFDSRVLSPLWEREIMAICNEGK